MKRKRKAFNVDYQKRTVPASLIDTETNADQWDKKELKTRSAYFMLNGIPEFAVNEESDGRFRLLAAERDFFAAKLCGAKTVEVRVYTFTEQNAEIFSLIEKLKEERHGAMEEGYLMKRLIDQGLKQDDIAALIGKSRPAVANTLRLLTLDPSVVGLVVPPVQAAREATITRARIPARNFFMVVSSIFVIWEFLSRLTQL